MTELKTRTSEPAPVARMPVSPLLAMLVRSIMRALALAPAVTMPKLRLPPMMVSRMVSVMAPAPLFNATPTAPFSILVSLTMPWALPPADGCTAIPPPVEGAIPFPVMVVLMTWRKEFGVVGANLFRRRARVEADNVDVLDMQRQAGCEIDADNTGECAVDGEVANGDDDIRAVDIDPVSPPARMSPNVPPQSIVIDLVMVTAPKPPGSMQLISPNAAVFEMAPAKVLHGAVRLQGLTSSPTPETHVRVACAAADPRSPAASSRLRSKRSVLKSSLEFPPLVRVDARNLQTQPRRTAPASIDLSGSVVSRV